MNELLEPELDVLPKLVIELREDETVHAIVGKRVRGKEPQGPVTDDDGRQIEPGDVRPAGEYVAFVVLVRLGGPPNPRVPISRPRVLARCYGRTDREAAVLRNACSRAVHNRGPRVFANGLGIFNTLDVTGGEQDRDPDTAQSLETFVIEAVATTQAVAV